MLIVAFVPNKHVACQCVCLINPKIPREARARRAVGFETDYNGTADVNRTPQTNSAAQCVCY